MKLKVYKNRNEQIYKDEAIDYIFEKLGLEMTPKGKAGIKTIEQFELLEVLEEWYFSDWYIEEIEDDADEMDIFQLINEELELEGE